ncbi:MAG: hypothetical protein QOG15_2197 [Solirubrobacteraceae bacterium]|jgi:hypothetical protein|nr:hypothetical protein [Solirubrobacteraceae bacterium]
MLLVLVLALLAIGRWYPGSGAESIGWRPTRSPEVEADNEIEDIQQMLAAQNERRRRRGLAPRTEEDVQADIDAFEREQAERAARYRET